MNAYSIDLENVSVLRRGIGLIEPSRSPAFDRRMSVREVVATGLFATIRLPLSEEIGSPQWQWVEAEIERLGLDGLREEAFSLLSTGERMKALLARAMVAQAGLLLLDEPTGGLDMGARAACVGAMERLLNRPQPPTVLIVSHHVDELPRGIEQVVLLKQGIVFAGGAADEVLTSDRLSRLFECRVEVFKSNGRFVAGVSDGG